MPIVRTTLRSKDAPGGSTFTRSANIYSTDKRLSFQARGIMALLLTKPDGWDINRENLVNEGPDGIKRVRAGLKELTNCGYMLRTLVRDDKGQFSYKTTLYESPEDNPAIQAVVGLLDLLIATRTGGPKRSNGKDDRWTATGQPERANRPGPTVPGQPERYHIVSTDSNDMTVSTDSKEDKEKSMVEINFDLPPHSHAELKGEQVYWQDTEGTLHKAVCTKTMPRTLALARLDTGELIDRVKVERVFYQNGGPGLSPVAVVDTKQELTPNQLDLKGELARMVGAGDILEGGPRIAQYKKCNEAALFLDGKGVHVDTLKRFKPWYRQNDWRGKKNEPLTLKIISELWPVFMEHEANMGHGQYEIGVYEPMTDISKEQSIWNEVSEKLRYSMVPGAYNTHFGPARPVSFEDGDPPRLVVHVSPTSAQWIEKRLGDTVERAAQHVMAGLVIDFRGAEPQPQPQPQPMAAA